MDHKDRKYILENSSRMSAKDIAHKLGIKEQKVWKVLGKQKQKGDAQNLRRKTRAFSDFRAIGMSLVLIVLLGFGAYGSAINGQFIWDDEHLIENNRQIKSMTTVPELFLKRRTDEGERTFAFYRPIQELTYAVDYALWKSDVRGYHMASILWHVLAAMAVFWLAHLLTGSGGTALLSALFFVVHPLHTEAVAYIAGRADSLSAAFFLLAVIFYIRYLDSQKAGSLALTLFCYVLALLSRENSLVFPALILLYHFSFNKRMEAKAFISVLALSLVYIILRVTALKFLLAHTYYTTTIWERAPGFLVAVLHYARFLLFPFPLHMAYGNDTFSFADPRAIGGIMILCGLIVYAFRVRKRDGLAFFCIVWFLTTLFPHANLYPINAFMAEHWLYLPSVGLFIMLSRWLKRAYTIDKFRAAAIAVVVGALAYYSLLTFRQNAYWKEPKAFYEETLKYAPDNSRVNNNLGIIYYNEGRKQDAGELFQKAVDHEPEYAEAYNNLGNVYKDFGGLGDAVKLYEQAIEIDPYYTEAYNNLGVVYNMRGEKEKAIQLFTKAVKQNPLFAQGYNNLSALYYYEQSYDLAVEYYEKAAALGFENPALAALLKPYRSKKAP
ncbi:MAG: tetratricopeptide repeat protein [Candidatus Omnitrophica bacterium]|nr:tetratricopeptide repeat protein [Candidatus Omnitrophota bacterium]